MEDIKLEKEFKTLIKNPFVLFALFILAIFGIYVISYGLGTVIAIFERLVN